jgi:enamine deaminase RidA (YjgF/YER057c/UK114 family)
VKAVIGDLDKVKRVAKLLCMVNSAPDFGQHPLVANGATDLLSQLYGEAGAHARSAVGLAALPNGACIEIEMILEVEDEPQHSQCTSKQGRASPLGPLPAEAC